MKSKANTSSSYYEQTEKDKANLSHQKNLKQKRAVSRANSKASYDCESDKKKAASRAYSKAIVTAVS